MTVAENKALRAEYKATIKELRRGPTITYRVAPLKILQAAAIIKILSERGIEDINEAPKWMRRIARESGLMKGANT